ncbi:ribosome biogenesis GTPase [Rhodococcus sp. 27YEA15]|uniref:ribosome small subunit-dependent GTPase A n=1 Tax=Rhodococcus sp. 27YEA15 TaxID=3156259 RepID=UPI003C79CA6C
MHERPSLLTDYGWNSLLSNRFEALIPRSEQPGRILRVDRGRCDVAIDSGIVRADDGRDRLCTGDWVSIADGPEMHTVTSILPRTNSVVRSSASGKSERQLLAANVDTVLITCAADSDIDLGRIERLLALTWESGATPVIALTKIDAAQHISESLAQLYAVSPGAVVQAVSARTHEGMDVLDAVLEGTVAILGSSGSGKSTLANAFTGSGDLRTGRVRDVDGKGRHTTAWRELIPMSGGRTLIDTPGLRGVGMWNADDGIGKTFPEIEELISGCRFSDCSHIAEPGCAVLEAIENGDVDARRLASYRKLQKENEWNASRNDLRLQVERAHKMKARSRSLKDLNRVRGR